MRDIVKIGKPHDHVSDDKCLILVENYIIGPCSLIGKCCCICQNRNEELKWHIKNGDGRLAELYCWNHGICEFFIEKE